jgi:hypothetical protein
LPQRGGIVIGWRLAAGHGQMFVHLPNPDFAAGASGISVVSFNPADNTAGLCSVNNSSEAGIGRTTVQNDSGTYATFDRLSAEVSAF